MPPALSIPFLQTWDDTVRSIVESLFPWPVILLVVLFIVLFWQRGVNRFVSLFRPFSSVKLLGAEFVLEPGAAPRIQASVEDTFGSFRTQIKREFDKQADIRDLRFRLERVLKETLPIRPKEFRCTIHVPDVLLADTIYQLLDYYPDGGGSGRTWSVRFGLIGLAWRLRRTCINGTVDPSPEQLMREWGMTLEEAERAAKGRQSFACFVLKEQTSNVGMLYFDAKERNAFSASLESSVAVASWRNGLTQELAGLVREMRAKGPSIQLHE